MVGMLRAHEMELDRGKKTKTIALSSQESAEEVEENNDPVSLIVRRFDKFLRRAEMGQRKGSTSGRTTNVKK